MKLHPVSRFANWVICAALAGAAGAVVAATPEQGADAPLTPKVSAEDIKMFPAAKPGQKRAVIALPAEQAEGDIRVELIVGKTMPIDCNQQWFGGSLKQEVVQGWGYAYYQLADVNGPTSTLMACPGQAKQNGFVPVRGDGYLLRYNSRLPIVVYVPSGFEVRYRLWRASNEVARAVEQ